MSRPFRTRIPATAGTLLRRRVQRLLQGRFDQRVTVVTAGAGFGKTTALANAIAENKLAPKGDDIWLGCEPGDVDPSYFLEGLAAALDLDAAASTSAIVVACSCGARGVRYLVAWSGAGAL